MNEKIQVPITFNAHKHHFRFLFQQTEIWKNLEWKAVEQELLAIGENLIDLYTGDLTVEDICTEISNFFNISNINDKISFTDWLQQMEYRKIELSDSSYWVVKEGKDNERFIHIHPAKHSPHSIRVRASTLKTVVALMVYNRDKLQRMSENLQTVNHIRTEYLKLSPIKSLQSGKGILHIWELFAGRNYATLPFN
jgi:hypothetical protein